MSCLSRLERSALDAFASAVRARSGARLEALTLFGSRARGEGRDDSDLDVLVVVHSLTREERRAVLDDAADVGLAHDLVLSPVVVNAAAWNAGVPLAQSVVRDGVPL